MTKRLVIAHLYPGEMNIYGDLGNIIALQKRIEWRGYEALVRPVELGRKIDWDEVDIIFGGGGQDSGQLLIGSDLVVRGEHLNALIDDDAPALVVCGLYQLFGRGFTTLEGQDIPGISVFRAATTGSTKRMIGNVTIESEFGRLVGFENHSGQTELESGQQPLGKVRKGFGNNSESRLEGARYRNAIGTYLHGPVLPKNPKLADFLILAALKRRWKVTELEPLDDSLEFEAAQTAVNRPQ